MRNKQELDDLKHLKQFVNLYKQCKDVSSLKKINNEEKEVFSLKTKGAPIRFGSTKRLLDYIPEREGLYDFWTDNDYFWIIPMETKPGAASIHFSSGSIQWFRLLGISRV
jgi:hypothetical protein